MSDRAIERTEELAARYPAAAELLRFYSNLLKAFRARAAAPKNLAWSATQAICPSCGAKPVAAVLRPEGDGGKRFLLCSQCLTEWEFRRVVCVNCEHSRKRLP